MSVLPKKLGKYEIRSVLGQGAMGIVYQGYDPDIERTIAIKVLHPHLVDTKEGKSLQARFRREAQAAARCFHPNIVTVFELGHDNGHDFIAMEYVQGEELKYFLEQDNQFTRAESALIIVEVLKALSAAHDNGVVHRDIKPANIILLDDGHVKVADFGVARIEQSDLTMSGHMVGTPSYMSPEGLRGESVDFLADIYSTAMVFLELLTGQKPDPSELYSLSIENFLDEVFASHDGETLSGELQQILRKGLAHDKKNRFPSAHDFAVAVKNVVSEVREDVQQTLEQLSETVINQKAVLEPATEEAHVEWDEDVLKQLEQGLASYIGPMAGIILKKSSTANTRPEDLIQSLAGYIDDPDEKAVFLKQASQCISVGCTHDSTASSHTQTVADTLGVDQLHAIAEKLAFYLGPMAQPFVKRAAAKSSDLSVFYGQLASHIPNEAERQEFLRSINP